TFADNATWGPDGFGGIVSVNGNSTIVNGLITVTDTAGTLVVTAATGAYTYTLNHNLLQSGSGENSQTAPSFAIVAKDGDGSTIGFSLNVNVIDDVPTLVINDLSVDRLAALYSGTGVFLAGADGAPVQPYTLTWEGQPSEYTFTQKSGTSEWEATFVDANNITQTFFTVTLKSDGSYDFELNTALPTIEKSSGALFSGITGGSNLASYTFTADKFGGAFSLVLTASDNKAGADTLTISATELGINGNSIQEAFNETLTIDVVQQPGFEKASLTSLIIGIASTGSLKAGDKFSITVYSDSDGNNATPVVASSPIEVTYDGSGKVVFDIPTELGVVDYLTLTPTTNNINFKITGMSVEYTQPIAPSDMNLHFIATGVDNDGDIVSDSFNVNLIAGTSDNDNLLTGNTNDTVSGGAGNDIINTGAGNDTLIGGLGNDTMTGGLGSDTFKWNLNETGSDKITDFTLGVGGDVLDLKDLLVGEHANATSLEAYLNFSANDLGQTVITVDANAGTTGGTGQSITLENVQYSALQTFAGGTSDADILAKLLTDGNLKTDL
ncbi:MAG: type I secretion C-terminal target domain-containing protein, partial [Rhodoferax sp.]